MKKVLIVLVILILQTLAIFTFAQGHGTGYDMWSGMMNWGYGMGWGWSIIMIAFWIAVIIGIIFLIRWVVLSTDRRHDTKAEDSSLEILQKRYAKGEINKEEFEEKKKDLV